MVILFVLGLLIAVAAVVTTTAARKREVTLRALSDGQYRIYTPGMKGTQVGRYYLTALGVPAAGAEKLATAAHLTPGAVQPGGATFLVFRGAGEYDTPITGRESLDLSPLGIDEYTKADQTFKVTALTADQVTITLPAFDSLSLTPCYDSKCLPGTLRFGTTGVTSYQLIPKEDGFLLTQAVIKDGVSTPYYYQMTSDLCPAPVNLPMLVAKCSIFPAGTEGGPRLGQLLPGDSSTAPVFYFEPV